MMIFIDGIVLVFEGGGMCVVYISVVIVKMFGLGWKFLYVFGIFVGFSFIVNYIFCDFECICFSFIDFVVDF